jgi:uncharacterized membrane protein YphA (DoxX/SURF4 family)
MEKIVTKGQVLFAIAIAAFGIQNLVFTRLGLAVRGVPWFPENHLLGYLAGLALLAAGISLASNQKARFTAILLGIVFLLLVFFTQITKVAASALDLGVRTVAFETLAMAGSALTLAGTLRPNGDRSRGSGNFLDGLIESGPYLFAVSSVVFGIDHFLILGFIASLVPSWIPAPMFWAYFTGAVFIAVGLSIAIRWMDRWAAFMLGVMFLLWFLLLHAPRVMSAPRSHDPNEWSSAFIALGMCGGSWICSWHAQQRQSAK